MALPTFEDLVRVMATLRGPGGCPWDRQQTHASLRPYLLEEAYEVLEAIERGDPERLRDELGDLLLQVLFHAQIAAESGSFTVHDVVAHLHDKLVRRHPHVFPDAAGRVVEGVVTPEQVMQRWEGLKRAERGEATPALDGVPSALPALLWAQKLYQRAREVGWEWPDVREALGKLEEEVRELREALEGHHLQAIREEVGDVLMAAVKVAAFTGTDAEGALRDACRKFIRRFETMERLAAERGQRMEQLPLSELLGLWQEAKERAG
ncbi:MAG: nucleoside triphosphate pyrophosphohydrolase [Armatimonadetes bacterium]|nr:nucleoside triphosphate pyrophosphohydrolase [Armatimonadota bacterium]MDW8154251.1 nucleoside triphosphate pyrophosphohydrolase [Armatimonadota bacterium]